MYRIKENAELIFEEKQTDGKNHYFHTILNVKENQEAYYAEEYVAPIVKKKNVKDHDITVIISNEENKTVKYHAIDLKKSLLVCKQEYSAQENLDYTYKEISHFISQMNIGYSNMRCLEMFNQEYQFQFIPMLSIALYDIPILHQIIDEYVKTSSKNTPVQNGLLNKKLEQRKFIDEIKVSILKNFSEGKIRLEKDEFNLEILYMENQEHKFVCKYCFEI